MDDTQQRLRELLHMIRDDPNWMIMVTELGIRLSYRADSGHVIHKIVSWEALTLTPVNPLLLVKRKMEDTIKMSEDDDDD